MVAQGDKFGNADLGQTIQAIKLGSILLQVKWEDLGEF